MAKHNREFRTIKGARISIERWIEPRDEPPHSELLHRHLIDQTGVSIGGNGLAARIELTEQDLITLRDHLTSVINADMPEPMAGSDAIEDDLRAAINCLKDVAHDLDGPHAPNVVRARIMSCLNNLASIN
jgi:hypothetical protein